MNDRLLKKGERRWTRRKEARPEEITAAALDLIESVGVSIQNRMIAKARKLMDAWKLNLAGVPMQTAYATVSPSSWADPEEDDQGWYHLTVNRSDYASHQAQNSHFFQSSSSHQDHTSTSGSGPSSNNRRTAFPSSVPSGSRVRSTRCPFFPRTRARRAICVVFPAPSTPSNEMNIPRTSKL